MGLTDAVYLGRMCLLHASLCALPVRFGNQPSEKPSFQRVSGCTRRATSTRLWCRAGQMGIVHVFQLAYMPIDWSSVLPCAGAGAVPGQAELAGKLQLGPNAGLRVG